MGALKGMNVPAAIVPFDSLDTYATHDAAYGRGGYRSVDTIALRDAISADRKTAGMIVRVQADKKEYEWNGSAWIIWQPASVKVPLKLSELGEDDTSKHFSKVEEDKLAGIAAGANAYVHPTTHPATVIVEDGTHRFMTDVERAKLAGIAAGANAYVHPATHPATMIVEDGMHNFISLAQKNKLDNIEANANDYLHPATHPADMITDTAAKVVMTIAERNKLTGIEPGANKTIVDAELSLTSPNPLQNKVISAVLVDTTTKLTDLRDYVETMHDGFMPVKEAYDRKNGALGLVQLDGNGKILVNNLPGSFNDNFDILVSFVTANPTSGMTVGSKYYNMATKQIFTATSATTGVASTPDSGNINVLYLNKQSNKVYYWSGTDMVALPVGSDLQLGETATTAYPGNKGKQLYDDYEVGVNGTGTKAARNFFKWVEDGADEQKGQYISGINITDNDIKTDRIHIRYSLAYFDENVDGDSIIITAATKTQAGLMSAADKVKFDSLPIFDGTVYFGVSAKLVLTEADVVAFGSVSANRALSEVVQLSCAGGRYPYVIYPNNIGTRYIHVNGLLCTDTAMTTLMVNGAPCFVLRLAQIQNGNLFCSLK